MKYNLQYFKVAMNYKLAKIKIQHWKLLQESSKYLNDVSIYLAEKYDNLYLVI